MRFSRIIMISIPLCTSFALLLSTILFLRYGSCPEGNFSCASSDMCVLQRLVCNGKADCPNGEDEDVIICSDLHGGFSSMIASLKNRTSNAFCELSNVPKQCKCKSSVLCCKSRNLTEIPTGVQGNVNGIIVMNTQIELFDTTFLNYHPSLINLGNNGLTKLPSKVFKGQIYLKKLFLIKNKLETLNGSLSVEFVNLNWLFLYDNYLTELKAKNWKMQYLTWLDASKNKLTLKNETFNRLTSLKFLYLERNMIQEINNDIFANLTNLIDLDLSWNIIKFIGPRAFASLYKLTDLLTSTHFLMLKNVQKLQLGGNARLEIGNYFFPLESLRSLNLKDIELPNLESSIFEMLTRLEIIYFKKYKYCTYVPQVKRCVPRADGLSSENDLIANDLLRWTLWTIMITTLITNSMVILRRVVSFQTSPLSLIITNLAIADMFMGVYLLIIGAGDLFYRNVYRKYAHIWVNSWTCTVAGVIAMMSSEASILFLLLISAERFLLISSPLGAHKNLTTKSAYSSCISIWLFSLLLAILPVFNWRYATRFYGKNSFCFPLHIDEPYMVGWQYSSLIFLGINSFSIIGIGLMYVGVFVSIWKTRNATTLCVNDSSFALRFIFIVMANCCCWVPIIVLKIMAFLSCDISKDIIGWIGVFILPVNSAVNPVLYTFTIPNN
ncbi:relaxin receptor 2 isoform X2 [Cimex lectularius]|uniref:G-protein coupled receptors family 1 profile domain-containing protein n=1 Tax=Cimex lectularius TaxID=79782 RepID=A0A8I6SRR4_CIMLE|nr:relaxin receptor 2 isoform X2 [Cimex lectularius]